MRTAALPPGKKKQFQAALSDRWRLVFDVGIATGWRISDILGLRPWDLKGRQATISAKKTGKAAAAALPVSLVKRLRAVEGQYWIFPSPTDPTFPVTRQAAYKAFKKAASGLKLSGSISPHSTRKTFAMGLYRAGKSVSEIQAALQHDKLETTLLYLLDIRVKPKA